MTFVWGDSDGVDTQHQTGEMRQGFESVQENAILLLKYEQVPRKWLQMLARFWKYFGKI